MQQAASSSLGASDGALRYPTAEAAWKAPVVVAVKTSHFFGPYSRVVPDCKLQVRRERR